jgi:D-arabinose 1-dehydrogenase-like Zn-dependent alcohol dehydrogenase
MPRKVVCRELGPPGRLRLEAFEHTPLGPGQIRVAIRAAGINFPDILMAAGEYQLKPELPFTPGMEAAGDVVEVNGVVRVAVGDRVIVKLRHGGYADEVVVAPSQLAPLPSAFDYAEGATFLAGHGTAYHGLIDRGQLKRGEVLLVAWRRRRRGAGCRRDRQGARRHRDRRRLVRGEAAGRESARRRPSRALRPRAVPRCGQAHHRRPWRRRGL